MTRVFAGDALNITCSDVPGFVPTLAGFAATFVVVPLRRGLKVKVPCRRRLSTITCSKASSTFSTSLLEQPHFSAAVETISAFVGGFFEATILRCGNKVYSCTTMSLMRNLKRVHRTYHNKEQSEMGKAAEKEALEAELLGLEWDARYLDPKKYREEDDGNGGKRKVRGRVMNKRARHNLLFRRGPAQAPDYAAGRGRIVSLEDGAPALAGVEERLFGEIARALAGRATSMEAAAARAVCEGNFYYDAEQCGIGFHGDAERSRVVCLSLAGRFSDETEAAPRRAGKPWRIALTWGGAGENHAGNQLIGEKQAAGSGYTVGDHEALAAHFGQAGLAAELVRMEAPAGGAAGTAVLVVREWLPAGGAAGESRPFQMRWQWFHRGLPVGDPYDVSLRAGDVYIMAEKAVGADWRKSSIPTLRHAAGHKKYTSLAKWEKKKEKKGG